jgi:serine/threonine-protein kinase RsbW
MSLDDPKALRLTTSLDHVGLARDFVAEIAKNVPMNARQIYDLGLVVDEALTNVIEHGYEGREDAQVEITVQHEDDSFTIVIAHDGHGFDPDTQTDVDLKRYIAERRVGGLGLYLMKKLMDEVEYTTGADGRRQIRLVKKHPGGRPPALDAGS